MHTENVCIQSELFMNYPVFQLHPQITLGTGKGAVRKLHWLIAVRKITLRYKIKTPLP